MITSTLRVPAAMFAVVIILSLTSCYRVPVDSAVARGVGNGLSGQWQETAPGIAAAAFTWPGKEEAAVTAVRAEPGRCTPRVVNRYVDADRTGDVAEKVCPPAGAAINASFFGEDGAPIGLLIVDGKRVKPLHRTGAWGIFLVRNGKPLLHSANEKLPSGITQALQSKPRLVIGGKVPAFKPQGSARRSAVGIDAQGRLVLAATDGYLTLEEWAQCLHDRLNCVNALNLDGGPSTQLAITGKITHTVKGGWPVPVFITIAPRKGK